MKNTYTQFPELQAFLADADGSGNTVDIYIANIGVEIVLSKALVSISQAACIAGSFSFLMRCFVHLLGRVNGFSFSAHGYYPFS